MTRQQLIEDACLPFADQSLHHTQKKREKNFLPYAGPRCAHNSTFYYSKRHKSCLVNKSFRHFHTIPKSRYF
jgi:hypothetical protein